MISSTLGSIFSYILFSDEGCTVNCLFFLKPKYNKYILKGALFREGVLLVLFCSQKKLFWYFPIL